MKKNLLFLCCFVFVLLSAGLSSTAQDTQPDTVSVGIYITSIHDIDFKEKEYTVNFWLWLKYKNRAFDFFQNLEVPQAKTVTKSFVTADSSGEKVYMQMKLQCVMKDSWKIGNFPFDTQKLRIAFENSQFDSRYLVFVADTVGNHFDTRFTLRGWTIDSCVIATGTKAYETAFGDDRLAKPRTEYSTFRVRLSINREAMGLFWKLFLGMYLAFLIAYTCFFIHADSIDSRFGLSVGSLFAVVGNKYIIDSSLPESTSFTLVDTLHGLTMFCIFVVIISTAWSLKLVKSDQHQRADRFDRRVAVIMLLLYIALNGWFISEATTQ
jgi:hypothetical protein